MALAQRPRHLVTVASAQANRRASGALPCPLAAPTMILIRWASPWEQEGRRSSPVSTVCWAGLTLMGRGHGPGIGTATWTNSTWPARTPLTTPTLPHPLTHFRAAVLVPLLLLAGVALVTILLLRRAKLANPGEYHTAPPLHATDPALTILRDRYVRGELSTADYEEWRHRLSDSGESL